MNKKVLVVLIVVVLIGLTVAGIVLSVKGPMFLTSAEKSQITTLVEDFGKKLTSVDLLSPEDMIAENIQKYYSPYLTADLLMKWTFDPFHAMAIDPNHPEVVYGWIPKVDSSSVIYDLVKSKDYGVHFTKIANFEVIMSIVVDPKNSNKIYVTTNNAILRTTNGGKSWETFFTCEAIPWINPHNTDVILTKGCNFAGTKDGGKTWDNLNFFKDGPRERNEPIAFAFDPVKLDVVYGITHSHIFKSEDNGSSWAMLTTRYFFDLWGIAIDQTNPGKIYLGCDNGILVSEDGGKTFVNLVSLFFYTGTGFSICLSVDSTESVYVVLAGIPLKMNAGGNWLPLNSNFIKGGPQWSIADGVFYVDIKTIKSDTIVVDINDKNITFYRLYYMGP